MGRRCVLRAIALLLIGNPAAAQMMITVQPDRVAIGSEFVPRRLDLPRVLKVPAGSVTPLPADSTWDYIEVAGTLRVDRTRDTVVRFTHLIVLPGGVLDVGTTDDPIATNRRVTFIIRNVPIDTARDPFQWGNGILNFGAQTRVGAARSGWVRLAADPGKGETLLQLDDDPVGWAPGDELLIPDTVQAAPPAKPRRESPVTIAAIAGRIVTLSKPLDFAHPAIRDVNGAVVLMPRVANLTRNIVIRSENPANPGHTANVGMDATFDIRYNALVDLGRTRAVPLNDSDGTRPGTNQRGRYAEHEHHTQGFGSTLEGNVYRGTLSKWGVAVHGTHDLQIEDNVTVGFPGAGFVTEDGYEVRNVFRHNLAAYSFGNRFDPTSDSNIEGENALANNPGAAGNGFWFRGVMNRFEANEAWNSAIGINLFNQNQPAGSYPSKPGGASDTAFDRSVAAPLAFTDNVEAANGFVGLEFWGLSSAGVIRNVASFNGLAQFFQAQSDPARPQFRDSQFVCSGGKATGLALVIGYTQSIDVSGGKVAGCAVGLGGPALYTRLTAVTLQNVINVSYDPVPQVGSSYYENVVHVPYPGSPQQFIVFGNGRSWPGTGPLPVEPRSSWEIQQGSRHLIKNWQGTNQDFRLFERQQLASAPAWPSTDANEQRNYCPEAGLTMGQCWQQYGLAYGGEVLNDADAVALPGVINGLAARGLTATLGPPRAVVTYPTAREPAAASPEGIAVYVTFTGNSSGTSGSFAASVNGQTPVIYPPPFERGDLRQFTIPSLLPGLHIIQTWRLTPSGAVIPASAMNFRIVVGTATTPPPSPRPLPPPTSPPPPAPVPTPPPPSPAPTPTPTPAPTPPPADSPAPTWTTVNAVIQRFGTQDRYRICVADRCVELQIKPTP